MEGVSLAYQCCCGRICLYIQEGITPPAVLAAAPSLGGDSEAVALYSLDDAGNTL